MTPRRWGPETRLVIYRLIAQRDGDKCAICGVGPTVKNPLDIDHIDGNPKNNAPNNVRLLCRRCNVATSNRLHPRKNHSSDLREREKTEDQAATRVAKEDANYREGSSEMQASLLFEGPFREWLIREVATHGSYRRTAAIADGAELVGCSPSTTAKYITKLTSRFGPLLEIDDPQHHRILLLKPHLRTPPHEP
jgi:transposase-like protein